MDRKVFNANKERIKERLCKNVKVGKPDECWEWTGKISKDKPRDKSANTHGNNAMPILALTINGRVENFSARKAIYEVMHGFLPPSFVTKNTCDNPKCMNPAHITAFSRNVYLDQKSEIKSVSERILQQIPSDIRASKIFYSMSNNQIMVLALMHKYTKQSGYFISTPAKIFRALNFERKNPRGENATRVIEPKRTLERIARNGFIDMKETGEMDNNSPVFIFTLSDRWRHL